MGRTSSRFAAAALAAIFAISLTSSVLAQDTSAPPAQPSAAASGNSQVPQGDSGVNWPGVGYGAGSVLCSLVYIPFKLTYAILGGLVGGGAWAVTGGNTQIAETVWRSSLGGDYVITPQMLAGQQPINFSGPTDTAPAPVASTENPGGTSVQPIQPLPGGGSSASAAESSARTAGSRPMDSGTGPGNSGNRGIE